MDPVVSRYDAKLNSTGASSETYRDAFHHESGARVRHAHIARPKAITRSIFLAPARTTYQGSAIRPLSMQTLEIRFPLLVRDSIARQKFLGFLRRRRSIPVPPFTLPTQIDGTDDETRRTIPYILLRNRKRRSH